MERTELLEMLFRASLAWVEDAPGGGRQARERDLYPPDLAAALVKLAVAQRGRGWTKEELTVAHAAVEVISSCCSAPPLQRFLLTYLVELVPPK